MVIIGHYEFVQSESTNFERPMEEINSWQIDFPFTILKEELDLLKKNLVIFGENFKDVNNRIHFTSHFGKQNYEDIESFLVTDKECVMSKDLTTTVCDKKTVDQLKKKFSQAEKTMAINARTILQLDHRYQENKFMSDDHLHFFYKWYVFMVTFNIYFYSHVDKNIHI